MRSQITRNSPAFILSLLAWSIFSVCLSSMKPALADDPPFKVTLSASAGGTLSAGQDPNQHNPVPVGTATASLAANDPNQECQVKPDSTAWTWGASDFVYSSSSTGSYAAPPQGMNAPGIGFKASPTVQGVATITATSDATTTPGYWEFTVTATAKFDSTCASGLSKSNSTTAGPVVVAKIDILRDGQVVTNSNQIPVDGQRVHLSYIVAPADLAVPSSKPLWSIPGSIVKNWSAIVIPADQTHPNGQNYSQRVDFTDYHQPNIDFCWYDSLNNQPVSLTVTGVPGTARATFSVVKPITKVTQYSGPSAMSGKIDVTLTHQPLPGGPSLEFGLDTSDLYTPPGSQLSYPKPGIYFTYDHNDPLIAGGELRGDFEWLQIANLLRTDTFDQPIIYPGSNGPAKQVWQGSNTGVDFPGGSANDFYTKEAYGVIPAGASSNADNTQDSPGEGPFPTNQAEPMWTDATAGDSFSMYIMFKPTMYNFVAVTDAIYVPLRVQAWNWFGDAGYNNNTWSLVGSPEYPASASDANASDFPAWTITANPITFQ